MEIPSKMLAKSASQIGFLLAVSLAAGVLFPPVLQAGYIAGTLAVVIDNGGANVLAFADGAARDQDGVVNGVIEFDSNAVAGGFPANFPVSGTLSVIPGLNGAAAGFFGAPAVLTLTDFDAVQSALNPGGQMTITFSAAFDMPATGKVNALDHIEGTFGDVFGGAVGPGTNLTFQGFVQNGAGTQMAIGANFAPAPPPLPFAQPVHLLAGFAGDQPWFLFGQLTFDLAADDFITLPDSAQVAIEPVPEPGTLVCVGGGILGVLALNRRFTKRAIHKS